MSLALLVAVASCDNGNAEFTVVDVAPTVSFGALDGLVEGGTFSVVVNFSDGAEGSTTSTLASASWTISSGGAEVASGTLSPSGDNWEGTITANGLTAGDHSISVTATDSNGNAQTESTDFTVASAIPDITGAWTMEPVAASLAVGPAPGSADWWFVPAAETTGVRACFYDDVFTFGADGSFSYDQGGDTFVEDWQGGSNACGTPVAPFDGSGTYTYSFNGASLTLVGTGAHIGLPKVNNEGEINQGAAVASQITYDVAEVTEVGGVRRMKLLIEAAPGVHWTFLMISQ